MTEQVKPADLARPSTGDDADPDFLSAASFATRTADSSS